MRKYKKIKAALLGMGTVGGGVYKLLEKRKDEMPFKIQADLEISRILVRDLSKKREGIPDEALTDSWEQIVNDPEIQIVIELMGGIEPARTYILQALKAGKHVVTANKDLMAEHGEELMDAADRLETIWLSVYNLAVKKAGFTSRRLYYKAVLHACPVAENRRCFTPLRKTVWRTADNYLQKSYIGFRGVSSTYPKRQY